MKIKVKKGGKVKQFKLINSWSDVSLETWLKLIEFDTGNKAEEAEETIAALSNMPKQLINQLSLRDVAVIMGEVAKLQAGQDSSLKRIIEINGVEYGFHPKLDDITLGEYADLETFIKNGIEKHLPEIMAVLYRPVTEKTDSGVYTIKAYDDSLTIRAEEMKKMSAEQVQGALVFFYRFVNVLSMTSQSSLMETLKEMKEQLQVNPSQKSGDGSE